MKRKLYAALIAGAVVVSMMGTTVMAASGEATGDTDITYTVGTAGPTDPVNPGQEETSENNWMVVYPREVVLTDSNVGTAPTDFVTDGAPLQFTVKQKQAGADNNDTIKSENIPTGIDVTAVTATTTWTDGTADITLQNQGSTASGTATMNLGTFANAGNSSVVNKNEVVGNLTATAATNTGYALITDDSKVVNGGTYGTTITFKFAPGK